MRAVATPIGQLLWPKLLKPDEKFNLFSANIRIKASDGEELLAKIQAAEEEALAEARSNARTPKEKAAWSIKNHPYTIEEDDDGNPTGFVIFKIKQKGSGISKGGKPWEAKPPAVFDKCGKPMKLKEEFGKGTLAQVSFKFSPYAPSTQIGAGISLTLLGVMVHEVGSNGSAESLGFTPTAASSDEEAEDSEDVAVFNKEDSLDDEIPF